MAEEQQQRHVFVDGESAMAEEQQQHHVFVDGESAMAEEGSGIGGLPLRRKCGCLEPEQIPAPQVPRLDEDKDENKEKETKIDRTGACCKNEGSQSSKPAPYFVTFRNGVTMDVSFLAGYFKESDERHKKLLASRVEPSKEERFALWEVENRNRMELAIQLYNAEIKPGEGLELELAEPLVSTPFCLANRWIHMNFIAKPKNGSDDGKRRYFSELRQIGLDKYLLTVCCPVEPKGNSRFEMTQGCLACKVDHEIYHPPAGSFKRGVPNHFGSARCL